MGRLSGVSRVGSPGSLGETWRRWRRQQRRVRRAKRRTRRAYKAEQARLRRRAREHRSDLVRLTERVPDGIAHGAGALVSSVVHDEILRLPYFLEHYRKLGFQGFLFADDDSTDGTREFLLAQEDVLLYAAEGGFYASRGGSDWQQAMIEDHVGDRWALLADADELLVFPGHEEEGIAGLIARAEARGERAVLAPMIDMYPASPLGEIVYESGRPMLSAADRFDGPEEHFIRIVASHLDSRRVIVDIKGGVRHRAMDFPSLEVTPLLSKVPLARRGGEMMVLSPHTVFPPRFGAPRTSAALLHFKLLHDFAERCEHAVKRGQHWDDCIEYRCYLRTLERDGRLSFDHPAAMTYTGPESLEWLWRGLESAYDEHPPQFVPFAP